MLNEARTRPLPVDDKTIAGRQRVATGDGRARRVPAVNGGVEGATASAGASNDSSSGKQDGCARITTGFKPPPVAGAAVSPADRLHFRVHRIRIDALDRTDYAMWFIVIPTHSVQRDGSMT